MPKRVKHHDRDKYYHLAKDQGYRARSAFKLIQINRKHDILSKAKVCIDLCAAPGGWLQVAAQVMPSQSIILGVDLLPIRPIPNVKTFVADITTGECRDRVRKELQGWKADVVLCDGAPNVGAAYVKDAYVQNELVLAALKTATDHLMRNGTFCTKVYRSQDYNKLLWVLNQLFTQVIAIKPSSSRSQSAEIFMLCKGYVAPDRIDPRILDPAHVFAMVEGEQGGPTGVTIFSKSFDASHRRRQGYGDATNPTLRSFLGASEFIDSKDPVQALTDATEIRFEGEADDRLRADACTTEEVLEACADLRVLGKADFKMLLKWRLKVRKARAAEEEAAEPSAAEAEPEAPVDTEEAIQQEIAGLYDQMARKRKREKKKVREKAAKLRERKAYGMDNNAFEVQEHDSMFNLASAGSQQLDPLEAMSRMELLMEDEDEAAARANGAGAEDPLIPRKKMRLVGASGEELDDMEDELEGAYAERVALQKAKAKKLERTIEDESLKKRNKRSNKAKEELAGQRAMEDAMLHDGNMDEYYKRLAGDDSEDDDGDSDDDVIDDAEDGSVRDPLAVGSGRVVREEIRSDGSDLDGDDVEDDGESLAAVMRASAPSSLLVNVGGGPNDAGSRWFSKGTFQTDLLRELESEAELARLVGRQQQRSRAEEAEPDEGGDTAADAVLESMPLTDKQLRAERRRKLTERKARREARKLAKEEKEGQLEIVSSGKPSAAALRADSADVLDDPNLTKEEKQKLLKKRDLLRRGLGAQAGAGDDGGELEIVPSGNGTDDRVYDSDHEDYDSDDQLKHLAIGHLMLRKGRRRALIDASYNRYAWNDPAGLPSFFTEDEAVHNRPQVPIPKAVMNAMREKYISLANKPIKKVMEARARKKKRVADKLRAARQKAETIAGDEDLSQRERIKQMTRTMNAARKNTGTSRGKKKPVVVARKFHKGKGGGGLKVDRRMKSDKAGEKRAARRKAGRGRGRR